MSSRLGLGLGHERHPLLGKLVLDRTSGRTGVLRAICPEPETHRVWSTPVLRQVAGPRMAWLVPVGGGVEWTTTPDAIEEATA
ncbi:hypothetical protein [Streptomyces phytophilus]|uniref:hypothetical protein n=1 Tax=Streptomyces phytophilus TaxID=722715 RepID=UPI0015F071C3|nr:hypothetical protein [Streptomyces phytophilus]